MNFTRSNLDSNSSANEGDISLSQMVEFFLNTWKKLLASLVLGALLGLSASFLIGTYTAEYIFFNPIQNVLESTGGNKSDIAKGEVARPSSLIATTANNVKTDVNLKGDDVSQNNASVKINSYAMDLSDWKAIQKGLPSVAMQVVASGKVSSDQIKLYRDFADDAWWKKNAIPSFLAVTKVESKDIAGTIKDLDPESFVLLSLTITHGGRSAESALKNVQAAAEFLRTAGAYIQVRNLLNGYEAETISTAAEIQKRITSIKIEMTYLQTRLNKLGELRKRFPDNVNAGQQTLEPKDSGAKFLPLTTQMIATQNDINALLENLQRNEYRLAQLVLIKTLITEAKPLAIQTFDGITLSNNLLSLEAKIRAQLSPNDNAGQEMLDRIRAQLLQIQSRFTKGIEPAAIIKTSGMAIAVLAGSVIAFLLTLLWLLGRQSWLNAKKRVAKDISSA
jgi:hypothetical protein